MMTATPMRVPPRKNKLQSLIKTPSGSGLQPHQETPGDYAQRVGQHFHNAVKAKRASDALRDASTPHKGRPVQGNRESTADYEARLKRTPWIA